MLQDIYYSRKSDRPVQVIARCRILPDGTDAICFQEMGGEFSVFVLASKQFDKVFYKRKKDGQEKNEPELLNAKDRMLQSQERIKLEEPPAEEEATVPGLIRFLDADTYQKKIKILEEMKDELDDHILNNMAVSLDLSIDDGVDGYAFIMSELKIRSRFEGKRGDRL